MLLAIETSGSEGSIALLERGVCRSERSLQLGGRHGQTLLPEVDRLLRDSHMAPQQLTAIAVGLGPGSYTGLRIGVVCAKTLAFAIGCPLVGVETLRCIAAASLPGRPSPRGRVGTLDENLLTQTDSPVPHSVSPDSGDAASPGRPSVWVIADALRDRLYTGHYATDGSGHLEALEPLCVREQNVWLECLRPGDLVSGPGTELVKGRLPAGIGLAPQTAWLPRAVEVGCLGADDLARGIAHDPATLTPLYLRESSAETQWDKLHGGRR